MPDYEDYLAAYLGEAPRGQQGRNPTLRFARSLLNYGFKPTYHFVDQFLRRARALGHRFDVRTFRAEFFGASHYSQKGRGYNTRIAVVRSIPVIYRRGGRTGRDIVLITVLDPKKLPKKLDPIPAPAWATRESDLLLESGSKSRKQHGSAYRREQQKFLKNRVGNDRNQPRFIRGWIEQERLRRLRMARKRKPASIAGKTTTARKFAQMRAILADPGQNAAAKKWARRQLQRLYVGQKRLNQLKTGERLRTPDYRAIPGYDTGHPIPHVPDVHDHTKFRVETARDNRSRWAKAIRLKPRIGKRWKHYAESEY